MHLFRCIVIGLLLPCVTLARAETQFPYEVTVGPGGVDVRCGPGAPFYVTDRLPTGTKIEVYRRDDGGWLAIRPPASSCSWVRKAELQATAQPGVAEVVRDDAISCIGSSRVQVRDHLSYVSLHRGELVQLLEGRDLSPPDSLGSDWQAIAPPAGEFRWVFQEDLKNRKEPPKASEQIRIPSPSQERTTQSPLAVAAADAQPNAAADMQTGNASNATSHEDWQIRQDNSPQRQNTGGRRPANRTAGPTVATPVRPDTRAAQGDIVQIAEPMTVQPLPVLPAASAPDSTAVAETTAAAEGQTRPTGGPQWASRRQPLPGELSQLESELSLMVSRPMSIWRLASLRERTVAIIDKLASGSTERVHAEGLLERIGMFEQLQDRYVQTGSPTAGGPSSPTAPGVTDPIVAAREHYDGTGWLVPVHATRPTAPPYALLDAQGDILHYVTPTPGLNLYRYVKQKVGIYGQRSFMPSLQKPHLVAERIIDLDRHFR